MKVILLRDVAKIGKRYEVANVPDGFALNKLIPQGDAQAATPDNVKRVANMRLRDKTDKEGVLASLRQVAHDLKDKPLSIAMEANQQGHLFKSVKAEDVAAAASKLNMRIPVEYIVFAEPIKSIGQHQLKLKAQGESFMIVIEVIAK